MSRLQRCACEAAQRNRLAQGPVPTSRLPKAPRPPRRRWHGWRRWCRWCAPAVGALLATAGPVHAEPPPGNPAADAAFVQAVDSGWYVPRSAEFAEQAQRLTDSLQRLCTAGSAAGDDEPAARAQWLLTAQSWERLSAVRAGALLARRSPREIDFMPTRPEAISRAVAAAPRDAAALDRIGSPAKGLPALEWLLWTRRLAADAPSCRYAQQVAAAVVAEAQALHAAYRRGAAQGRDAAETEYAMYELLNLWDAGLQKLWWEEMDRPLQKARDGRAVPWSRATSGHTVAGWRQQWQALRALAVGAGAQVAAEAGGGGTGDASDGAVRAAASGFATAAPDGAAGGAFVDGSSLRQRLLADGRAAEADRLLQRVAAVDRAMAALLAVPEPAGARPGIAAAVLALKDLQQFAETELAAALHFIVSFFDEDGD